MFGKFFDFGEQKFHKIFIPEMFSIVKILHRKFYDNKNLKKIFSITIILYYVLYYICYICIILSLLKNLYNKF